MGLFDWLFQGRTRQLFEAIAAGDTSQVRRALATPINLATRSNDPKNFQGYTPLEAAAYCCLTDERLSVLRLVIAAGAPLVAAASGRTALHVAAQSSGAEAVELLIEAGANIDATATNGMSNGWTPLHYAVEFRDGFVLGEHVRTDWAQEEVVLALLQAGANSRARTSLGSTPLDRALTKLYEGLGRDESHYLGIVAILSAHGADVHLFGAGADSGSRRMGRALLDHARSRLEHPERTLDNEWTLVASLLGRQ